MRTSLCKLLLFLVLTLQINAYNFTATVDNTHPMLGEKTTLTLTFTYDNLEEYEIEEPIFEDFKLTLLEDTETQENNGIWVATLRYALTPLRSGTLTLPSLHTTLEKIAPKYQKRYNRNKYLEKITLTSNPITLQVIPLPKGITVTGEYQLHTSVDKHKVLAGKPVIFTLTLAGHGNIDNLNFITLSIPHTTTYGLNTTHNALNKSKTFSIISDSNYTIPSIVLKYFNQSSQEVELLSSDAINITVEGGIDRSVPPMVSKELLLSLLIIGLVLLSIYLHFIFKCIDDVDKSKKLFKRIKYAKDKESLLKVIAPYIHESKDFERLVYRIDMSERSAFNKLQKETIMKMRLLTQK